MDCNIYNTTLPGDPGVKEVDFEFLLFNFLVIYIYLTRQPAVNN